MDEILANAKNILVVWISDAKSEVLIQFEKTLQTKAKQAKIVLENIDKLLKSQHEISSFDLILSDIVNEKDSSTSTEYLNEFFRLLRPNGYLIMHIEHLKQNQAVDHFKMCGFTSCNPLDSNSSFLIENKDDNVKRKGLLWLCQKPSFDIGYSVPLRKPGINLIRQISTTGGKKTWTVENEDDEDDEDDLIDHEPDRTSWDVRNANQQRTSAQTKPGVDGRSLTSHKPNESSISAPRISDV